MVALVPGVPAGNAGARPVLCESWPVVFTAPRWRRSPAVRCDRRRWRWWWRRCLPLPQWYTRQLGQHTLVGSIVHRQSDGLAFQDQPQLRFDLLLYRHEQFLPFRDDDGIVGVGEAVLGSIVVQLRVGVLEERVLDLHRDLDDQREESCDARE